MKPHVALFYHSLVSDWNHGNAHFLRGVAAELQARGHLVTIFEPRDNWSRVNLLAEYGPEAVTAFESAFPNLRSIQYDLEELDLNRALDGVDLILVHEWNDPKLISALGAYRRIKPDVRLFFHDTHHRTITATHEMDRFDLTNYDGVLAYGRSLQEEYRKQGWGRQVHVWHEAADTRTFYPQPGERKSGDIVWIGNWGDEERTEELREFFIAPVKQAGWKAQAYGVRYPAGAKRELRAAGIGYRGWLPNFQAPGVFSQFHATLHVPRRPYTQQLPGIPTIRPFEALACGIPLVSAPWRDVEGLFRVGQDFLMAENGAQMAAHLRDVLNDGALAKSLSENGLETIRARHTCAHRVDELMDIYRAIQPSDRLSMALAGSAQ